jgi:hypothetical protein
MGALYASAWMRGRTNLGAALLEMPSRPSVAAQPTSAAAAATGTEDKARAAAAAAAPESERALRKHTGA